MESIKQSIQDLAQHFNSTMAEFQHNLSTSVPASSPSSNTSAQFSIFRTFVLSALENLQKQVEHLSMQQDHLEMYNRRKILLVHGVPEDNSKDVTALVITRLSAHLNMPDFSAVHVSRCQRIGQAKPDKPRPILLKFRQMIFRNKVWFDKSKLKNSGITLSEFLTKDRHEIFMAARQRFGVSKCWTKEGAIFVIGPDGKRLRICSKSELDGIPGISSTQITATTMVPLTASAPQKPRPTPPILNSRTKRTTKK